MAFDKIPCRVVAHDSFGWSAVSNLLKQLVNDLTLASAGIAEQITKQTIRAVSAISLIVEFPFNLTVASQYRQGQRPEPTGFTATLLIQF